MTYKITTNKKVCIEHEDDWSYVLEADVYGNIHVVYYEGTEKKQQIALPYDGIGFFIDALNNFMLRNYNH